MDIYTLQDYLTMTKGQEYLIAIGAMILFAAFWLYLDRPQGNKKPGQKEDNRSTSNTDGDDFRSKA